MLDRDAIPISRWRRFRDAALGVLLTAGMIWIAQRPVDQLSSSRSRLLVDTLGPTGFHVLIWAAAAGFAVMTLIALARGLRGR